eukprot:TRINITY_DN5789_c0_g1_i1.p3 TRINITY_DN5789_c0_g1~~TRINITY_DN5789_c0_g1_i1.p3  ORF type:complete len:77 (+),score=19.70 TRINITY_DN5789_c0_g1_i1:806-1036(+)
MNYMLETAMLEPEDPIDRAVERILSEGTYNVDAKLIQAYKKAFQMYDLDNSGDIDASEFRRAIQILEPGKTESQTK